MTQLSLQDRCEPLTLSFYDIVIKITGYSCTKSALKFKHSPFSCFPHTVRRWAGPCQFTNSWHFHLFPLSRGGDRGEGRAPKVTRKSRLRWAVFRVSGNDFPQGSRSCHCRTQSLFPRQVASVRGTPVQTPTADSAAGASGWSPRRLHQRTIIKRRA